MKGKQALILSAIALSALTGLTGCQKDDSAAVSALQELTTELSGQVAEQNDELLKRAHGCGVVLLTAGQPGQRR